MKVYCGLTLASVGIASVYAAHPHGIHAPHHPRATGRMVHQARQDDYVRSAVRSPFQVPSYTESVKLSATPAPSVANKDVLKSVESAISSIFEPHTTRPAPPPPTTCAPKYKNKHHEIKGTGTLPKPTSMVKTFGNAYTVDKSLYRPVGPNIYWLCNDENIKGIPKGEYTSKARIREALAIAVAMGANTVRLTSCGVSEGRNTSIEMSLGQFADPNAPQWDNHDYAIYAAGQYGLRVILPLTDMFDYYHGGLGLFAEELGVSPQDYGLFFDPRSNITSAFLEYIHHFIPHVNRYNGKQYADDPTIFGWETGNELGAYYLPVGFPPVEWTNKVAAAIRTHDKNHIIIDGGFGILDNWHNTLAPGLLNSHVQSLTDHYYPRNVTRLALSALAGFTYQKPWFVGEYDWTASSGQGDPLDHFLGFIEADLVLGDLMWGVQGHDDQCCQFVRHNDGYAAYYPNGNSKEDQVNLLKVVQHWYKMTGRAPPLALPAVACPQPEF